MKPRVTWFFTESVQLIYATLWIGVKQYGLDLLKNEALFGCGFQSSNLVFLVVEYGLDVKYVH